MGQDGEVLFSKGLTLFNQGEYFACHEIWEELWKRSTGEKRIVLQGLIQAAAALLHAQRGNRRGALLVYRKAMKNLATAEASSATFSFGDLRKLLEEHFKAVEQGRTITSLPQLVSLGRLVGIKD